MLICTHEASAQDAVRSVERASASAAEQEDDLRRRARGETIAETERVVVTGSYIPTAETESALPVTIYTAGYLQKQGANTPVEGMRQLPSFVGGTPSENNSNGGDGAAFINLRALGAGNTLTLLNSRRTFGFTNVNAIPISALLRTEVLRDGASAIYGSDAVAGVVNFILLNAPGEAPYEGAELHLLYGNTTEKDANVRQAWVRGGVATKTVAIAAAAEYYNRAAIFARDREISAVADLRPLGGANGGSGTYPGRITFRLTPGVGASARASVLIDPSNNAPAGAQSYRAYGGGNSEDPLNFREFTPAIPAVEKAFYYLTGRYKIFGEALQIYGDALYAKTKQDNGLAATPFTIFSAAANSSPYNPFPPATLTSIAYRTIRELGLRKLFFDIDQWRYVAGLSGNFALSDNPFLSALSYDSGIIYEQQDYRRITSGDLRRTPLEAEIAAGNFNPFIGLNAPLAATIPTYNRGVPTGVTRSYDNVAAAERASYTGRSHFEGRASLVDARVSGNLLPRLYQGGIGFNFGFEYRTVRDTSIPDPVEAQLDQLGFSPFSVGKTREDVHSYFGEVQIPLVLSTMEVPGIRSLEVAAALRFENFDYKELLTKATGSFESGGTPRISLRYQPMDDVTLRASYGQSFLPPGPNALLARRFQSFVVLFDPLLGQNIGLTRIGGGNSSLKPEYTDTYTAGLVLTPRLVPGFTMTVDFYQLYTTGLIISSAEFAQLVLTANGNSGGTAFADLVEREEGTNIPLVVRGVTSNAGKRLVTGVDTTASYEVPTQTFGKFTFSLGYNYFFTWKAEPVAGLGTTSFLGNYTRSIPLAPGAIPYHKGFLRGEWQWRGFNFISTVNYISSFNDDSFFLTAARRTGGTDTNPQWDMYRRVSDYITLDLQLSYEFRAPDVPRHGDRRRADTISTLAQRTLWGTTVTVGVNNAFNRNPPIVLGAFNDNYDTSLYTIRNRYYY
ncbi:MAG: TonB-dependent receptor, partial [Verrucomicrobiaceae bacterium]|nr:TonB-dependent receptor [Verrucomicrobiaceae bacterium]